MIKGTDLIIEEVRIPIHEGGVSGRDWWVRFNPGGSGTILKRLIKDGKEVSQIMLNHKVK